MRFKSTLFLLVVLVALMVVYFTVVRTGPGTKEWLERHKRLFDLEADKVEKLEVVCGDRRLALERKDDKWRLTAPIKVRASADQAQALARKLESLEYSHRLPPTRQKKDLKTYGLDKPVAVITALTRGRRYTLKIGAKPPLGRGRWAMTDRSRDLFVIDEDLLETARKPLEEWRDKDLLAFDHDNVHHITIRKQGRPKVELARHNDHWRLLQPVADAGEKEAIDSLLDKLDQLSIDTFVNDNPTNLATYGLDEPALSLALSEFDPDHNETRTHLVLLGKHLPDNEEKIYAKLAEEKSVYAVSARALKDLAPTVLALRQKALADFPTYKARKLLITYPNREVLLARDTEDRWVLEKPALGRTEANTVDDFLDQIKKARAELFLETQPLQLTRLGLGEKQRTTIAITLRQHEKDTSSERLLRLYIGKRSPDGKYLYAQRAGDPFALALKTKLDKTLKLAHLAFRDRAILDFEKAKARKLALSRDGKLFLLSRPDKEDEWSMEKPVKAKADYSNVSNILWDLSSLRAKKLVAEKPTDLAPFGLDKPTITVSVTYKDKKDQKKTHTKTLHVGKKAEDDTYYARLADGDLVFTVGKMLVDDLRAELHYRTVLDFDRDKVKSITIAHAGQPPFTFVKSDDKWELEGREELEVKKEPIDDLLNDLNYLQTERFAAYEPKDLTPFGLDKPRLTVTIRLKAEEHTLLVGKPLKDGKALAKLKSGREVFELKKEVTKHLLRYLGDYLTEPTATRPTTTHPTTSTRPTKAE